MRDVRILHVSDVHLDWPYTGLGGELKSRLRREELKASFAAIIDLALREQVQVLLVAGDLFEHKYASRGTIKFIDDQFRRLGSVPVFISPGNHDPFVAGSYYETYPWAPNVYIFGPEPERIDVPGLPVTVRGWGFPTWEVRESQLRRFPPAVPGRVNLVVVHGGDAVYHPLPAAELAALGADYVALGHIHKAGVVLEQAGRVIARYSGAPEALGFGDPGEHGVFVGTVSTEYTRLTWVPVGRRQYHTVDVNVTGAASVDDLAAAIRGVAPAVERLQHGYRLTLVGAVHPELRVDVALLTEMLADEFYLLKLMDGTAPDVDLEALARERGARGLFVQRLLAMEQAESDPARRRVVRRALAHGLAAFAGKGGAP
ncbi:MAG TPA: DNA repair exonuclease [Symbiobacteriaceae bacterium]|nr:DNA repair exonuclease [Symbiobacteriaceae bacterium]